MTVTRVSPVWTITSEELPNARGRRYVVVRGSRPATFADVIGGWQTDAGWRSLFNETLAGSPYTAFRWETPPVTAATSARPFEFVTLDSPALASRTDRTAFADHFAATHESVTAFANLGGDAVLVVPCPVADDAAYGHLAAFVRFAPEEQRHAFWQAVGDAMARRMNAKPVWLSTAGYGVAWLHVRLDDRPKYYGHAAYKEFS